MWNSQTADSTAIDSPAGVAVDSHGDFYVTDANYHRVMKFTRFTS